MIGLILLTQHEHDNNFTMMTSKQLKTENKNISGRDFFRSGFFISFPFFFTVPKKETKIIIHYSINL
jgi:hypothetical protein